MNDENIVATETVETEQERAAREKAEQAEQERLKALATDTLFDILNNLRAKYKGAQVSNLSAYGTYTDADVTAKAANVVFDITVRTRAINE